MRALQDGGPRVHPSLASARTRDLLVRHTGRSIDRHEDIPTAADAACVEQGE